jgi:hypothetical protein
MDFRAIRFKGFDALDAGVQTKLGALFGEDDPAAAWQQLTANHDDQAALSLALAAAFARVTVFAGARQLPAFEMIEQYHLLAGDRLYVRLNTALFDAWKPEGEFVIARADGGTEEGRVRFNRGQFGASLHHGFDIQGVTALNRIPRIQWNYRNCDSLADIDIDGFSPWDTFRHFTFANSDPRQWYDRFQEKFGNAGFDVERVGNVPELRVEDTSTCPQRERWLTADEQAGALAVVNRVAGTLAAANDMRPVIDRAAPSLLPALRDSEQSPLGAEVAERPLANSRDADLLGYYAARINVERLTRSVREPLPDAIAPMRVGERADVAITTVNQLREMRQTLENEEQRQRTRMIDAAIPATVAPPLSARAWLSVAEAAAFGYRAGTRFVAAETGELQILLAPGDRGYELLFAVPRTKY